MALMMKGPENELAVYIHVPFCIAKCPYCDFYSITDFDEATESRYVRGIEKELHLWKDILPGRDIIVTSCYLGGGTPSLPSEERLIGLARAVQSCFPLKRDAEVTLEANPETVNPEKLNRLREAGFNRISIGVQSFDDSLLKALGRVHDAERGRGAVREAREAGFDNLSVDLIFGIPGQRCEQWRGTLQEALEMNPSHISAYNLTIEPGTPYHEAYSRGEISPPPETEQLRMFEDAAEILTSAGYEHYEISNYALPNFRCRHNIIYWKNKECLGLGPGASSYVDWKRSKNVENLETYIRNTEEGIRPLEEEEILTGAKRLGEALMLGLRMMEGVDLGEMGRLYGDDPMEKMAPVMDKLAEEGLLAREGARIRLTRRGIYLSNEVFMRFL